jgi:hypothetical protein
VLLFSVLILTLESNRATLRVMPYKDPTKQKAAQQRSYIKTQPARMQKQRRNRRVMLDYVAKVKTDTPCADCENFYHHSVMDFDHLPKFKKVAHVSVLARRNNWELLLSEIAKCDVVCANCHRIRTYMRKYGSLDLPT